MRAFLKKEWMEVWRTGRAVMLLFVFVLFGIMNPAIAKMTPYLMTLMSESLGDAGMVLAQVPVDALTSWTQFYKNIPLALIIFVLVCSSTFTAEYQKGTLVLVVTKGLSRVKIVLAKAVMMSALWTAGYLASYGITWLYNSWFWDNSIASHIFFGAACYWIFGLWVIALMLFFSAVASAGTQVLAGTGGVVVAVYVSGLFPKLKMLLPSKLMDGMALLQGTELPSDYYAGMVMACLTGALCVGLAVACFKRKML